MIVACRMVSLKCERQSSVSNANAFLGHNLNPPPTRELTCARVLSLHLSRHNTYTNTSNTRKQAKTQPRTVISNTQRDKQTQNTSTGTSNTRKHTHTHAFTYKCLQKLYIHTRKIHAREECMNQIRTTDLYLLSDRDLNSIPATLSLSSPRTVFPSHHPHSSASQPLYERCPPSSTSS